ncbi:hypothetical protein SLH49_20005 [Cognatiyoonia sp. IB215446]|uniref:hypothetical protein n=1 Tax=Cognatiyoonia sp. IB215446 TaxID=3097355 RepID=UPI002A17C2FF|nr:hypothetical protein [Cognatiyoonia sp. IB215446]MDX8350282.1 hypothetical protein [Cognatiyoonia sp. IB215446]
MVLLVAGLIAPRMSAAIAQVIPGVQVMVICTGDQMVTLTIGADGEPIEVTDTADHVCIKSDVVKAAALVDPFWSELDRSYAFRFAIRESTRSAPSPLTRISPSRAPPVVV